MIFLKVAAFSTSCVSQSPPSKALLSPVRITFEPLEPSGTATVFNPILVAFILWVGNGDRPLSTFFSDSSIDPSPFKFSSTQLASVGFEAFKYLVTTVRTTFPDAWYEYQTSDQPIRLLNLPSAIVSTFKDASAKEYLHWIIEEGFDLTRHSDDKEPLLVLTADFKLTKTIQFLFDMYASISSQSLNDALRAPCIQHHSHCLLHWADASRSPSSLLILLRHLHSSNHMSKSQLKGICAIPNLYGHTLLDLVVPDDQDPKEFKTKKPFIQLTEFLDSPHAPPFSFLGTEADGSISVPLPSSPSCTPKRKATQDQDSSSPNAKFPRTSAAEEDLRDMQLFRPTPVAVAGLTTLPIGTTVMLTMVRTDDPHEGYMASIDGSIFHLRCISEVIPPERSDLRSPL